MTPPPPGRRLISEELSAMTVKVDILPGYKTDHSLIYLTLNYTEQDKGKGLFKFNSSLLRDECYSEMVRRVIRNTIIDYALPVYLPEYLVSCITCEGLSNVQFTISDFLLFEVLILNIRTETITYSIRKSKEIRREKDTLNTSIERLEQEMSNNPDTDIAEQLSENRRKLESIREIRLRGSI